MRVRFKQAVVVATAIMVMCVFPACSGSPGDAATGDPQSTTGAPQASSSENSGGVTGRIQGLVTADGLRVRELPDLTSPIVASLEAGDVVAIAERTDWKQTIGDADDYWYSITMGDLFGWAYAAFISVPEKERSGIPVSEITIAASVAYEPNGATQGEPPETVEDVSEEVTVASGPGTLSRDGFAFAGWNTAPDGTGVWMAPGEEVEIANRTVLYAQWLDVESDYFSRGRPMRGRRFLRPAEFSLGEVRFLVSEGDVYRLSVKTFEDIVDPFVTPSTAYRRIDDLSSREIGLDYHPEHHYQTDLIGAKADGKYGFVRITDGFDWAIDPAYEDVRPFKDGRAAVKLEGKWGYIDMTGEMVVSPRFDFTFDYFHGRAVVANGGRSFSDREWSIIDENGNLLFPPTKEYRVIYPFYDPLMAKAQTRDRGQAGIGIDGTLLIDNLLDWGERGGPADPIFFFDKETKRTVKTTSYGEGDFIVFDNRGNVIASGIDDWDAANRLTYAQSTAPTALLPERDDASRSWGYVNSDGEWVIEPQFEYAVGFHKGVGVVKTDDGYGLIDPSGAYILDPAAGRVQRIYSLRADTDLLIASVDDLWGLMRLDGTWLFEPTYDEITVGRSIEDPIFVRRDDTAYFVNDKESVIYQVQEGFEPLRYREGITFLYRPVSEIDHETSAQLFQLWMVDEQGTRIFPAPFVEAVTQWLA